jgi:hypothetical protein
MAVGGMLKAVPRRGSPYDHRYQRARSVLLRQRLPCALRLACDGATDDSADHDPPLALHVHVAGSGCCRQWRRRDDG